VASIPKKVQDRLVEGIKKFKPIVEERRAADICEADTVILVTELLADLFGYDKLKEITSEYRIKGNRCDLATKIDNKLQILIEVKAIGHTLKDQDAEQAVNYVANKRDCTWALLTNGQHWRAYSVQWEGAIVQELVVDIDFLSLDHKSEDDLGLLYLLCKEGWAKSAIDEYQTQREALSRFFIGATILSDPVLAAIRKELKHVSPDVHITTDDIKSVIENEVIKREVLDGEKAKAAEKAVSRAVRAAMKVTT
jgi:hypothetical protein